GIHGVVENGEGADGHDVRGAVHERHGDRVRPDDAGVDGGVRVRAHDGVDARYQVVYRRSVVLDLHQAHHVGVQLGQRGDELRRLTVELEGVLGATRVVTRLERREVVQHVERRDAHAAAD